MPQIPVGADEFIRDLSDACRYEEFNQSSPPVSGELKGFRGKDRIGDEFDLETVDKMLDEILLPPTHPEMRGRLGRNEIESVIGCGGMGVVLRGYDRDLQRPVAVKLILPRLARNGTAKQRFAREARAAAAVLHPNVIAIHGIDETNGVPWFVMPLILGPSLHELVNENGPLPEKEIVRIGLQIASGLAAAHSQGLVHRDIKPENILVDNRVNRVVITDFGLARRESEEPMTQTGCLAGTLNYMSPEQTQGGMIDARSDLFSLGSLLYFLASGVVPFRANSPMGVLNTINHDPHPDVRGFNPEISQTLASVIDRLLEKEPAHRFQSAVELESFFGEYIAHLHQPTLKRAPAVPKYRTKSRLNWSRTLAVVASSVFALAASWFAYAWYVAGSSTSSPEMLWSKIQQTYALDTPDAFRDELKRLGSEFLVIERKLESQAAWESSSFVEEARRLKSEIDEVDRRSD